MCARISPGCAAPEFLADNQVELRELLADVQSTLAPLCPLKDFVAVNPFVGLTQQPFLAARETLRQVRDGDILLPLGDYRKMLAEGQVTGDDLARALHQCREEYPELYSEWTVEQLLADGQSTPH